MNSSERNPAVIAFGPRMPGWGSWEWIGEDLVAELAPEFQVRTFEVGESPVCDVMVLVKHLQAVDVGHIASQGSAVVFCPVDGFGSSRDIDVQGPLLRQSSRILVHCERLRRYFEPYASVEFLDHHVKFIGREDPEDREPFILWTGVRDNLVPLAKWMQQHWLPHDLVVLTNLDGLDSGKEALSEFGLPASVRIEKWSAERHRELAARACAAIDIKGTEFAARHKPPAKAIDSIASGLPLAMNSDSSSVEHLARMGFSVASPEDVEWWFSPQYRDDTRRMGAALRELLSRRRVGLRLKRILHSVLAERDTAGDRLRIA